MSMYTNPGGQGGPALQPHRGTTVLVLGILSMVTFPPLGIVAWVMGKSDLDAMRRGVMDPSGQGMTNAGYILGIIATVLTVLTIIPFLFCCVFGVLGSVGGAM